MDLSIGGALRDKMTDRIGKNRSIGAKVVDARINNTRSRITAAVTKASRDRSSKIAALIEVRAHNFCKRRD